MNEEQRIEFRIAQLNEKYGDRMLTLYQRMQSVRATRGGSFDVRMRNLIDAATEFASLVGRYSACKKDCSFCCYQAVTISDWEAEEIFRKTGRKATDDFKGYLPVANTHQLVADEFSGQPCPFLKNNLCSIYDARPLMCRLHLNMGDDASRCDILGNPGAQVPYYNFELLKNTAVIVLINGNRLFGDIREFFPT